MSQYISAASILTPINMIEHDPKPNNLSFLKRLSICAHNIDDVIKLVKTIPNLEELKLSIQWLRRIDSLNDVEIPNIKLKSLHLEYSDSIVQSNESSFNQIQLLLKLFSLNIEIHSLTLIVINAQQDYASNYDKFHSLTNNLTNLQTFDYYIRTLNRLDHRFPHIEQLSDQKYACFTLPRLLSLLPVHYLWLGEHTTLDELLNCTTLGLNLDAIQLNSILLDNLLSQFKLSSNGQQRPNFREIIFSGCREVFPDSTRTNMALLVSIPSNLKSLIVTSNKTM